VNFNGIRMVQGMSVDGFCDPVHTSGGQSVVDAFMLIYGDDSNKAGALNSIYLKVDMIG
jgi:hypothetical protein